MFQTPGAKVVRNEEPGDAVEMVAGSLEVSGLRTSLGRQLDEKERLSSLSSQSGPAFRCVRTKSTLVIRSRFAMMSAQPSFVHQLTLAQPMAIALAMQSWSSSCMLMIDFFSWSEFLFPVEYGD